MVSKHDIEVPSDRRQNAFQNLCAQLAWPSTSTMLHQRAFGIAISLSIIFLSHAPDSNQLLFVSMSLTLGRNGSDVIICQTETQHTRFTRGEIYELHMSDTCLTWETYLN